MCNCIHKTSSKPLLCFPVAAIGHEKMQKNNNEVSLYADDVQLFLD